MPNIHVAKSAGFCFGVEWAIDKAMKTSGRRRILGHLVHNPVVVKEMEALGASQAYSLDEFQAGDTVIVTAHGVSDATIAAAKKQGLQVVDTTCPLVYNVHNFAKKLEKEGYTVIVIGDPNHVEVKGTVGNLQHFVVVNSEPEAEKIPKEWKIGVVCQTTTELEKAYRIKEILQKGREPEYFKFYDSICGPTRQRQTAAIELSKHVDSMIVIGGSNSANTKHLHEICSRNTESHWIQYPEQLQAKWFEGKQEIGVTAGASTPKKSIDAVITRIRELTGA